MAASQVKLIAETHNLLGEGILWHPQLNRLFWFDILDGSIHWCNADGTGAGSHKLERTASAAAWIDNEMLLLAMEDGFYSYRISDCSISLLAALEADRAQNRSNDGRCDPWGRFWVGTMDRNAAVGQGALYIYDGYREPQLIKGNLTIPNSIAFSPDRRHAYVADSAEQTIFSFVLDPDTGDIQDESVFATTKGDNIVPDGSVVDAEGCLWNAQWDGWRIARYRPDGNLDSVIELPVQRPTCPAFGGKNFNTLFVCSAKIGLSAMELENQPDAGGIFAIKINVSGLPEPAFHLPIY